MLVNKLVKKGYLRTKEIIDAFYEVKRIDFLPEKADKKTLEEIAEIDEPLPIGFDQTISQPLVVAFMLELINPREGENILDVGAGSGWTSALLAYVVSAGKTSKKGKVVAVELIRELKEFGERNVAKYNFIKNGTVKFVCDEGSKGYEEESPFDKILCSAAIYDESEKKMIERIPREWKKQLKTKGRIVVPVDSSIWVFIKKTENEFESIEYPGFAFVPLIQKNEN